MLKNLFLYSFTWIALFPGCSRRILGYNVRIFLALCMNSEQDIAHCYKSNKYHHVISCILSPSNLSLALAFSAPSSPTMPPFGLSHPTSNMENQIFFSVTGPVYLIGFTHQHGFKAMIGCPRLESCWLWCGCSIRKLCKGKKQLLVSNPFSLSTSQPASHPFSLAASQ